MLKKQLSGKAAIFIDYANVKSWLAHMKCLINLEILYQCLKNLPGVEKIYFYYGTDTKNPKSSNFIQKVRQFGYDVTTKPVKYIKISLVDLLKKPINKQMLNALNGNTRTKLISKIHELDKNGVTLTMPKCNMDVEITKDMLLFKDNFDTFVLFSGDSDFAEIVKFLRGKDKKVLVVCLRRFLSGELFQATDAFINFKRLAKVKGLLSPKPKQNKGS